MESAKKKRRLKGRVARASVYDARTELVKAQMANDNAIQEELTLRLRALRLAKEADATAQKAVAQ